RADGDFHRRLGDRRGRRGGRLHRRGVGMAGARGGEGRRHHPRGRAGEPDSSGVFRRHPGPAARLLPRCADPVPSGHAPVHRRLSWPRAVGEDSAAGGAGGDLRARRGAGATHPGDRHLPEHVRFERGPGASRPPTRRAAAAAGRGCWCSVAARSCASGRPTRGCSTWRCTRARRACVDAPRRRSYVSAAPMTLALYNTLSRRVEPFTPLAPPRVTLYTCGPTVWNYAHIGNFRTFLFEDLLRRYLVYSGYDVFHIMNLTDVDDRTMKAAAAAGKRLDEH